MLFVGIAALAVVALMAGRAASAAGRSAAAWDAVARAPAQKRPLSQRAAMAVLSEIAAFEDLSGSYANVGRFGNVEKVRVRHAAILRAAQALQARGFPAAETSRVLLAARQLERDVSHANGVRSNVPAAQA